MRLVLFEREQRAPPRRPGRKSAALLLLSAFPPPTVGDAATAGAVTPTVCCDSQGRAAGFCPSQTLLLQVEVGATTTLWLLYDKPHFGALDEVPECSPWDDGDYTEWLETADYTALEAADPIALMVASLFGDAGKSPRGLHFYPPIGEEDQEALLGKLVSQHGVDLAPYATLPKQEPGKRRSARLASDSKRLRSAAHDDDDRSTAEDRRTGPTPHDDDRAAAAGASWNPGANRCDGANDDIAQQLFALDSSGDSSGDSNAEVDAAGNAHGNLLARAAVVVIPEAAAHFHRDSRFDTAFSMPCHDEHGQVEPEEVETDTDSSGDSNAEVDDCGNVWGCHGNLLARAAVVVIPDAAAHSRHEHNQVDTSKPTVEAAQKNNENTATQCPAEMEAAREHFKNWWRPTHMAALDKLQDGPSGRIEPIKADDCPDVPEMMEVIAEVRRLAREGYEEACEHYGQEWWDEHVERFERYPLVYGLYRAGETYQQWWHYYEW